MLLNGLVWVVLKKLLLLKILQIRDINSLTDLSPSAHRHGFYQQCYFRFTHERNIERRVCSNSKRKFPEDDFPERIESLSQQALRSSSLFNICEKKKKSVTWQRR